MSSRIPIMRRPRDIQVERAAQALSATTGDSPAFWTRVLLWRVRHFSGDLVKALSARTQEGERVFSPI